MLYKLLGMLVWRVAKFVLRRKFGRPSAAKPLVAGGAVAIAIGLLLFLGRRESDTA